VPWPEPWEQLAAGHPCPWLKCTVHSEAWGIRYWSRGRPWANYPPAAPGLLFHGHGRPHAWPDAQASPDSLLLFWRNLFSQAWCQSGWWHEIACGWEDHEEVRLARTEAMPRLLITLCSEHAHGGSKPRDRERAGNGGSASMQHTADGRRMCSPGPPGMGNAYAHLGSASLQHTADGHRVRSPGPWLPMGGCPGAPHLPATACGWPCTDMMQPATVRIGQHIDIEHPVLWCNEAVRNQEGTAVKASKLAAWNKAGQALPSEGN